MIPGTEERNTLDIDKSTLYMMNLNYSDPIKITMISLVNFVIGAFLGSLSLDYPVFIKLLILSGPLCTLGRRNLSTWVKAE